MNRLSIEDRAKIVRLLVEGNSLRSTSRITNIHIDSITKVLVQVGKACLKFHDETIINIKSAKIQCDEIWSFVQCKEANTQYCKKNGKEHIGDAWIWVGIDADTKLVVSWLVGDRSSECAHDFMRDVKSRLANRVQLTTDGFREYIPAVKDAFNYDVDYAMEIKTYGTAEGNDAERKYSPATVKSVKKVRVFGKPNKDDISTSYVERQNLTMRMGMRRFTRLTNAFSKKIENHGYAIAMHYVYYNFVRRHTTLRVTPAMAAKLTDRFMTIDDMIRIAYADEIEVERKRLARMHR